LLKEPDGEEVVNFVSSNFRPIESGSAPYSNVERSRKVGGWPGKYVRKKPGGPIA
jgi:hypothetical protein